MVEHEQGKTFSFKVSSKATKTTLTDHGKDSHFKYSKTGEEDKDYILSAEGQELKSSKPKKEKNKLVIPLIKTNDWRSDDKEAINEILADLRNGESNDAEKELQPILMKNRVPKRNTDKEDSLNDIDIRPDESTADDYEDVPIGAFGSAMLRGMGWKEGQGIGKTNKVMIEPIEYIPRHKGLGLGAEKRNETSKSTRKRKLGEDKESHDKYKPIIDEDGRVRHIKAVGEQVQSSKPVGYYPGSKVQILKGPHKELYGKIISVDEDNARVSVKLAISGEQIQISQYNTSLMDSETYKRYSMQKPGRKPEKVDKRAGRDETDFKKKRVKSTSDEESDIKLQDIWIVPGIRVRIISQSYKNGRYYNKKVKVLDVTTKDRCDCETDEKRLLEDIRQKDLETLIPKNKGAYVCMVAGKYKGKFGKLLDRNKRDSTADIQLTSNKRITTLSYDDICEYVDRLPDDDFL
eukprot:TCONS_00027729-protein